MSPLEAVEDQVAALYRQGRKPAKILVSRDDYEALMCSRGIAIYADLAVYDGAVIEWRGPRKQGPLVLPYDFRGFGQGACRPENAA